MSDFNYIDLETGEPIEPTYPPTPNSEIDRRVRIFIEQSDEYRAEYREEYRDGRIYLHPRSEDK